MAITITANRYNELKNLVNKVLGSSSVSFPNYGYGQNVLTSSVTGDYETNLSATDKITADQYRNLYLDLIRVRIHQLGAASVSVTPFVVGNYETNTTSTDKIEEAYTIALESLAADIEADRFEIDENTQADIENLVNSVGNPIRSIRLFSQQGSWNGEINHIFDVEFESAESRRHFFNSGGKIRLSANVDYAGSQAKTVDWQGAMSAMGNISFAANSSYSSTGVGLGRPIGNYQLTASYQACYRQDIGATYSNSFYEIYALQLTDNIIRFKASFIDGGPNDPTWGIEENVLGDFSSTANLLIPNGSASINGVLVDTVVFQDNIFGSGISNL